MRNWNSLLFIAFGSAIIVSEYLWGIETFCFGRASVAAFEYQNTYEELKRKGNIRNGGRRRKYQNTYEELKLLTQEIETLEELNVSEYLWGIETPAKNWRKWQRSRYQNTYEELKLCSSCSLLTPYFGIRIPMRNWNWNWKYMGTFVEIVSEYLWGIETHLLCELRGTSPLVSEYLWGIETRSSTLWEFEQIPVSEYLWGIET